jgi:hypothetical protein
MSARKTILQEDLVEKKMSDVGCLMSDIESGNL